MTRPWSLPRPSHLRSVLSQKYFIYLFLGGKEIKREVKFTTTSGIVKLSCTCYVFTMRTQVICLWSALFVLILNIVFVALVREVLGLRQKDVN
jgi:hypothetical protein